jgi:hypothetical protein
LAYSTVLVVMLRHVLNLWFNSIQHRHIKIRSWTQWFVGRKEQTVALQTLKKAESSFKMLAVFCSLYFEFYLEWQQFPLQWKESVTIPFTNFKNEGKKFL